MWGIIGKMFGSSRNGEKLVDGAVAGLDKIVFTEEERADANAQLGEWWLRYLEASQPQNIARRYIAIVLTWLFALCCVLSLALLLWWPEKYPDVFQFMTDVVATPFGLVMAFYFVTHTVRAYRKENGK